MVGLTWGAGHQGNHMTGFSGTSQRLKCQKGVLSGSHNRASVYVSWRISLVICGNPTLGGNMALIPLLHLDALFSNLLATLSFKLRAFNMHFLIAFSARLCSDICSLLKIKQMEWGPWRE